MKLIFPLRAGECTAKMCDSLFFTMTVTVPGVYWLMFTASFCYTLFTLLLCLMPEITSQHNRASVSLVFIQNDTTII